MAFDKEDLIKKLEEYNFPENEVVLSFEEFFDGNECETSIGVNIPDKPPISEFRDTFKKLLNGKLADTIFVRIADIEDPEEWVFTDTIYVIGKLSLEELESNIRNLFPDNILEGWEYGEPVNIGKYDQSKNVYTIFWD